MVLGLRSKHKKDGSIQVNYLIHVQEIKPWPPLQSLESSQSVLLQWENGDQMSGSLNSSVGDAKIAFNESFTLPLTLYREKRSHDKFKNNYLEFHLYEPRKDKPAKWQLLGTAIINLADYGMLDNILTVNAPLNCKKSSKIGVQPVLFVKLQLIDKDGSNTSYMGSLSKQSSLENDGQESASEVINEEIDDEDEIASFTDDDISSHSSQTVASSAFEATGYSPSQNQKDVMKSTERGNGKASLPLRVEPAISVVDTHISAFSNPNGDNFSKLPERNMTSIRKERVTPFLQSSFSSMGYPDIDGEPRSGTRSFEHENTNNGFHEELVGNNGKLKKDAQQPVKKDFVYKVAENVQVGTNSNIGSSIDSKNGELKAVAISDVHVNVSQGDGNEKRKQHEIGKDERNLEEKRQLSEDNLVGKFLASRKQDKLRSNTLASNREGVGAQGSTISNNKLKHLKSVQIPKASGFSGNGHILESVNKLDKSVNAHHSVGNNGATESKEPKNESSHSRIEVLEDELRETAAIEGGLYSVVAEHGISTNKAHAPGNGHILESANKLDKSVNACHSVGNNGAIESKEPKNESSHSRIVALEDELRETAAIEVGLYSIVAEHGSSTNKVHAPARRLSRFYLHACKEEMSQEKRANAARTIISGLVLVSKACGNDVPRLTFWLSNSVMLRVIVIQAVGELSHLGSMEEFDDWKNPETLVIALEKVEAWIFSRIVESVWWQALTPHMQSTATNTSSRSMSPSSRKTSGNKHGLGNQQQGNFSIELWKKAFKDACERLCPIRAGGHECGCLPVLARLVMEQLVGRLDVAMFNAILRESAEEMPTDPLSDPIGDLKVLPVPAGRSSFGAGAQLKNAIGNWSRWLTDLFGIEDNDSPEDNENLGNEKEPEFDTSFKPFCLLNALSDLMMLPFEMLGDKSTRKEVCPTFSAPVIKRVASYFVPDEFCPNPIPDAILAALDSEDAAEVSEESLTSFPCTARPTVYSPPPAASLSGVIGEVGSQALRRSGSSVLKKAYTSDDELDELDSPLTSIITDTSRVSSTVKRPNWVPKGGRSILRYQLLREVWRDGEW